jgi:hypothetical protein
MASIHKINSADLSINALFITIFLPEVFWKSIPRNSRESGRLKATI